MKNFVNEFMNVLVMDELQFDDLEQRCKTTYRMGQNPLPSLRKWTERNGLEAPIHYVESPTEQIPKEDLIRKIKSRVSPLIIVEAVKDQGLTTIVNMYVMVDKLYDRKDFMNL